MQDFNAYEVLHCGGPAAGEAGFDLHVFRNG